MHLALLLALGTPLLAGCAATDQRNRVEAVGPAPQDPVEAALEAPEAAWQPFELFAGRYVFLDIHIEGVATPAVLDCGAGITTVSEALAERIGLAPGRSITARGVGGTQRARLVEDIELELPGLSPVHLTAVVLDLSEIDRALGRPMPVVLGREFFAGSIVDLDYPNRRLALRPAEGFEYAGSGHSLELHAIGSHWAVDGELEGRPARFVLDTGSGGSVTVFGDYAARHALLEGRAPRSVHMSGGVGGMKPMEVATLASLRFAGHELIGVPAAFDSGGDEGAFSVLPGDCNSGNLLYRRFRMIFDAPHGRLHVEAGPDLEADFPRDRTGLLVRRDGDVLEVFFVAPESPAAAAGWSGDERIVAVAGTAVSELSAGNASRSWREAPAGTRVRLTLEHGEVRELVLSDYY